MISNPAGDNPVKPDIVKSIIASRNLPAVPEDKKYLFESTYWTKLGFTPPPPPLPEIPANAKIYTSLSPDEQRLIRARIDELTEAEEKQIVLGPWPLDFWRRVGAWFQNATKVEEEYPQPIEDAFFQFGKVVNGFLGTIMKGGLGSAMPDSILGLHLRESQGDWHSPGN